MEPVAPRQEQIQTPLNYKEVRENRVVDRKEHVKPR